jgi:hypothetical protein
MALWRVTSPKELKPTSAYSPGVKKVGREDPRSLDGIILNNPLIPLRKWLTGALWFKVDVYFSLCLGGEFLISKH